MTSHSSSSLRSCWVHAALSLLATGALLAACATGSQADDDDDAVGGGGGTNTGATTTGTGGTTTGGTGGSGATGGTGVGGARAPTVGEIVFTELMPDPDQLSDAEAEWLELKNVSSSPLELFGCHLKDADVSSDDLTISGLVRIEPGQVVLFAKVDNPAQNGNLPNVVFSFGDDFSLANAGDEAQLECGGQLIDQVAYTSSWPYATGVSMQLRSDRLTATDNDSEANWCTASASYASGNLGTPGNDTGQCL